MNHPRFAINFLAIVLLLTLLFSACSTPPNEQSLPQATMPVTVSGALSTIRPLTVSPLPTVTLTPAINNESATLPTAIPTLIPTAGPSPALVSEPPAGFDALHFATAPGAAEQSTFPAGTEEVYAIWDYKEMKASDRIRRIWFRDEQIWLAREENWNWGKYGSIGTVQDMSVFDNEGRGLKPAIYKLQLYVNDTLQQETSFTVLAP